MSTDLTMPLATGNAPTSSGETLARAAGNIGAPFAIVAIVAILLLFHETSWSMIALWSRSDTFAHGFMIVPISAWLVWRQRYQLASLPQRPSAAAFLLLVALGAIWLAATVANVQVIAQYAVTAMIPVTAVTILGWQAARAITLPLAYLLLAVPFGEIFIPQLIDFTAQFTVGALQLTGIPVFRENNYFSIPSGNWSVIEACSGLRYVIASLALGILYAYLNYRSTWRRLAFIAVALALPIFANGIRAFLIVMIGHWSSMRLAVGVDHLIYGWVFFGFVSMLLFWAGSFWREQAMPLVPDTPAAPFHPTTRRQLAIAAAACIAVSASWSLFASALAGAKPDDAIPAQLQFSTPLQWQSGARPVDDWQASHAGNPVLFANSYVNATGVVNLQVARYARQIKGAELLTPVGESANPAVVGFHEIESSSKIIHFGTRQLTVRQVVLQRASTRLLVWRWYRQSGFDTTNPILVKLLLAKAKLLHMREDGAEIIVTAPFDEQATPAQVQLHSFLAAMLPSIDEGLNHVASH